MIKDALRNNPQCFRVDPSAIDSDPKDYDIHIGDTGSADDPYSFKIELLKIEILRVKLDIREQQLRVQFLSNSNLQDISKGQSLLQRWKTPSLGGTINTQNFDTVNEASRSVRPSTSSVTDSLYFSDPISNLETSENHSGHNKKRTFDSIPDQDAAPMKPKTSHPTTRTANKETCTHDHRDTNDLGYIMKLIDHRKPPTSPFNGDPNVFNRWYYPLIKKVESLEFEDAIDVFEIHSSGEPRELINLHASAIKLPPKERYLKILEELKLRFGSYEATGLALYNELQRFPPISDTDQSLAEKLRNLSDLCTKISYNLQESNALVILNSDIGLKMLRKKLPTSINEDWRNHIHIKSQQATRQTPKKFDIFCEFLKEISDSLNADISPEAFYDGEEQFLNEQEKARRPSSSEFSICPIHRCYSHRLFQCTKFLSVDNKTKLQIINESKLCPRCLSPQHRSTHCTGKARCAICGSKLHRSASHSLFVKLKPS